MYPFFNITYITFRLIWEQVIIDFYFRELSWTQLIKIFWIFQGWKSKSSHKLCFEMALGNVLLRRFFHSNIMKRPLKISGKKSKIRKVKMWFLFKSVYVSENVDQGDFRDINFDYFGTNRLLPEKIRNRVQFELESESSWYW